MTVITDLLEQHQPLMAQLHLDDLRVVEDALCGYLPENATKGSVRRAVNELAHDYGVDADVLCSVLAVHWSLSEEANPDTRYSDDELDEAFGRRMKAFGRKVKRGYGRAKNSRKGRAVRRFVKAARKGYGRVRKSKHGDAIIGAALSTIGL